MFRVLESKILECMPVFFYLGSTQNLRGPFQITKETKLQWFQFRLINRILSCNKYLFKINKRDNDLCCFCNTETESLLHLFIYCNTVNSFWLDFKDWVKEKTNYCFNMCAKTILFGSNVDAVLNYIILLTKFFIYRCKYTD